MGSHPRPQPAGHENPSPLRRPRSRLRAGRHPGKTPFLSPPDGRAAPDRPRRHLRQSALRRSCMKAPASPAAAGAAVEKYYRFHSRIYDATRWTFLFGSSAILEKISGESPRRVLEVGSGPGRNLAELARRFPEAEITGVDLSGPMLELARRKTGKFGARLRLLRQAYAAPL